MRRRRILAVVGLTVAVLLAGEAGTRAIASDLPPALQYHSYEADLKVHRMDQLHQQGGAAVAFVGTSLVYGLDPAQLPRSVSGRTAGYNAALGSGIPTLTEPWALHSVIPRLRPNLLVLGLTSYDLSDDPAGQAFSEGYVDSKGGRRDLGRASVMEDVDHWLAQRSSLWDHRAALRNPSTVLDAVRGHDDFDDPVAATIQPTGRPSYREAQQFDQRTAPGGGSLRGWTIGTRNVAAVRGLIEGARRDGVRVVLLNMPVTREYVARHPHGAQDYQRYVAYLTDLAGQEHVPLVDAQSMTDHRWFADEVHLNQSGAEVLTTLVVRALRARGLLDGVLQG